jgi:SAM-dependent methyltransferase
VEIPFARSFLGRFFPTLRMREDWDLRARKNARYYIDCGHGESEETFWRSGQEDLENFILRDLEIEPEAVALEIGCGIGRLVRPLSERVARVWGFDISGEMIERGKGALADRSNVRLQRTDGDLAPCPDASVDYVFSFIVFQHIPVKRPITRYLEESARVLKGAGIFRFQADGRPKGRRLSADTWNGVRFGRQEIAAELRSAGFETLEVTGEGTQYMWVTARRREEAGRPSTGVVRFRMRAWDLAALDALLLRLGCDPAQQRDRVLSGQVSLRALAEEFAGRSGSLPVGEYVRSAYLVFLGREPDSEGLASYVREIEQGIARTNIIDCLLASAEFAERHRR